MSTMWLWLSMMPGTAVRPLRSITRVPGRGGVELRERRQPGVRIRRDELIPMTASDRGDPRTARDGCRARGDTFLHIGNRGRVLERHVIPGTISHEHDVVVVVDDAGHDGASSEIDHTGARARRRRGGIHGGKNDRSGSTRCRQSCSSRPSCGSCRSRRRDRRSSHPVQQMTSERLRSAPLQSQRPRLRRAARGAKGPKTRRSWPTSFLKRRRSGRGSVVAAEHRARFYNRAMATA